MTPTLQDVSMILGLPIQGEPLCMNTASDGWRGQMQDLIGMAPPASENPKERAPAGAPFAWIRTNFGELLPEGANEDSIRTYTRVYLWYMISRTLFADSGGKLAHWCWLKALTVLERRWSWGTAALAYLYRQLDDACRRTGSGGIGGCLLLLSVWSWDRLSVGRPRILKARPWPHYRHNLDREPTWAYLWDNVSEMTSDPKIMYRHYTEELDTLTAEQVDWEPYGTYYRIGAGMADLNPKCLEEARFWRMRCPLICMWLVEYHQPHRVMRQFGLYQECPPQWQDTDQTLHRLDRQRQRKITNWPDHHRGHVTAFQHCLEEVRNAGNVEIVPHDLGAFNNYLQWFHESTRIELVRPVYDDDILDDPIEFDELAQSQHDTFARRGRSTSIASELNFVRSEIQKTAEECEVVWDQSHTDEKPIGPMRHFIKNTARKMRRLANLLGCRDTEIAATSSSEEAEIPDDDTILSQVIASQRKKQATRSAYQLKPRGNAPKRYTSDDYVNRGKKVVIEEDETSPRRSTLRKMRNDEPLSSEEEEEQEQQEQEQQPRQRTKRLAVRKQPARRGRRGG
nr:serine/threonine-protein phosphatase 7 long form homolog [Lolium perenne]